MKYKIKFLTVFYVFLSFFNLMYAHESLHKAVVITPVADLIGQPICSIFKNQSVQAAYNQIPVYSEDIADNQACARLHQLLFNEMVEIVETRGNEALIKVQNIFYVTHGSKQPQTKYWIHKDTLIPLHVLHRKNIDLSKFPRPITYRSHNVNSSNKNTITLKAPFYDAVTKKTYSAGTRFMRNDTQTKKSKISVHIFDTTNNTFKIAFIPKKLCTLTPQNKKQSLQVFVQILKEWAHQKNGKAIPYVWGGCSFVNTHNTNRAIEQTKKLDTGKIINFYVIPKDKHTIKTGLDCTGMVARAAQITGIPYFFKNSTTVARHLKKLQKNESIRQGDILWIPGHVMVVSDIHKNKIIEARAYNHGYGKIQEIPLHEQFKNMHTFAHLIKAIENKKTIERLDKNGNTIKKITGMKILKLSSVWK